MTNSLSAVDKAIDLKTMPVDGTNIFMLAGGLTTFNDGFGGWWFWNSSSTTTANDVTVIEVTGVSTGRWLKYTMSPSNDYTNTGTVAGGAGNVVFYLTHDKTSTGVALYTNVNYVSPIVNDSSLNYTYGWSYNSGTKALTVNVKQATGIAVALVGLTLLGVPSPTPNGTSVQILVKGN